MTVVLFNGIILLFTALILIARACVVGTGTARITIDGREPFETELGRKLHSVLMDAGIPIAAACGGKGTCGLCRVRVSGVLDPPLATELAILDEHALARGLRLSCQITTRGDLEVGLPEGLPTHQELECRVRSSRNLTPLIKEIVLELPEGATFQFRAGSFVQINCPPHQTVLGRVPVDESCRAAWDALGIDHLVANCPQPTSRAYSMANHPGEGHFIMLLVRLALPPPGVPPNTPPGLVSSYLFGLEPGQTVRLSGPFGHFVATDSDKEMIFVGGGVGMAPMRAHVFEQLEHLHTKRKLSFWYGARSKRELIYAEEFESLAKKHPNFTWSVAL